MAGTAGALTIAVDPGGPAVQILSELPRGAGAAIKNIGGLDLAGATAGPDDCWIFVVGSTGSVGRKPTPYGAAFLLLSGDSLTLPADLGAVYAQAVTTATTVTVIYGVEQ